MALSANEETTDRKRHSAALNYQFVTPSKDNEGFDYNFLSGWDLIIFFISWEGKLERPTGKSWKVGKNLEVFLSFRFELAFRSKCK